MNMSVLGVILIGELLLSYLFLIKFIYWYFFYRNTIEENMFSMTIVYNRNTILRCYKILQYIRNMVRAVF